MACVKVKIEGKTPLLLNRFSDEAAMAASSGNRASAIGEKGTPLQQAQKKLYLDNDGKTIIMPQPNIMRCLIDAGSFFKCGKSKVTTQKTSLIPACVDMLFISVPLLYKEPWTVDTRPVRIPSTGGRILCHRPCFNDWALEFECDLDETMMTVGLLRELFDAAGKRIGMCDFRPACKGPFGKFLVTSWKRLDDIETNGKSPSKKLVGAGR